MEHSESGVDSCQEQLILMCQMSKAPHFAHEEKKAPPRSAEPWRTFYQTLHTSYEGVIEGGREEEERKKQRQIERKK